MSSSVSSRKRKTCFDSEIPKKKRRLSCTTTDTSEPIYVLTDMVSKQETSVGRLVVSIRSSSNISANNCTRTSTSKYTSSIKQEQVSAEYVQELLTRKRKAGSCEGPPRKRQKLSEHQRSSSCSSPQVKNPNTFPKVNTSKGE